ncbi:MAG: hypothetical protein A2Z25_00970 [Planctomycetes bacterium RBG_16_55_9]|nr:MAG: hypothetical protein A2Z25_00970 [Planctomycetes bacterium RBG_16_55_9]
MNVEYRSEAFGKLSSMQNTSSFDLLISIFDIPIQFSVIRAFGAIVNRKSVYAESRGFSKKKRYPVRRPKTKSTDETPLVSHPSCPSQSDIGR